MKEMTSQKFGKDTDPETYYDFNIERVPLWVIGGFTVLRDSNILYTLNVIGIVCVSFLYLYVLGAGVYTVIAVVNDKPLMVQTGYSMGLLCIAIGCQVSRVLSRESINTVTTLLRNGIFTYDEDFQEGYIELKKKRIKDLKFIINFISNGMYFCAFNYTVIIPLMTALLGEEVSEEDSYEGINHSLPLQIYVPFDTKNVFGYSVAYIANALVIVTMYSSFVCHEEVYISAALQLATECQVLSYSLKSIHKRAFVRLKERRLLAGEEAFNETLYDHPEYQRCLYLCLRENILHHHAILKFRDAMLPYIEAATSIIVVFFSFLIASAIVIMLQYNRPQLPSITDIFGFLPMCWVGQILADASSRTVDSLFDTPWPYCSEKFKVLLKMFMCNTRKPIFVKTRGVNVIIYLQTFADMVSLGYKIINVIR